LKTLKVDPANGTTLKPYDTHGAGMNRFGTPTQPSGAHGLALKDGVFWYCDATSRDNGGWVCALGLTTHPVGAVLAASEVQSAPDRSGQRTYGFVSGTGAKT